MCNKVRLDDDTWRSFGADIEGAVERGAFGGEYVSVLDPKQTERVREINKRVKKKWAEMPITYTDTALSRFAIRTAHSARETA